MKLISILIVVFGGYVFYYYGLGLPHLVVIGEIPLSTNVQYLWLGFGMMFGGILLAIYSRKNQE